jgi:hypothetical protein
MGIFCARAMFFPDIQLDIAFELFTHATTFFGLKVSFWVGFKIEVKLFFLGRIIGRLYCKQN